eukprot:COSAG04_NODE_5214_length_1700_cov_1.773267_1_plen_27_part_10
MHADEDEDRYEGETLDLKLFHNEMHRS